MTKEYFVQHNIGKARYLVNYHDGIKTHKDGSRFYHIKIANNVTDLNSIIAKLNQQGYAYQF